MNRVLRALDRERQIALRLLPLPPQCGEYVASSVFFYGIAMTSTAFPIQHLLVKPTNDESCVFSAKMYLLLVRKVFPTLV